MFRKVIESDRLMKENPNLIGKYVRVGGYDGAVVSVRHFGFPHKVLPEELSEKQYTDAFGTKS